MFAGPEKNRELIFPHQGFPEHEQGFFRRSATENYLPMLVDRKCLMHPTVDEE
jgi:hypothetical protein